MGKGRQRTGERRDGFSLIEILVAVLLLAVAVVPMLQALAPANQAALAEEQTVVFGNRVRATLCRVAALPFEALEVNQANDVDLAVLFGWPGDAKAAEALKEEFTFMGRTYRPTVTILDASGGGGGLLELSVTAEGVTLRTLKADY